LRVEKKSEETYLAAQPPTLAAFLPWGIQKELAVCPSPAAKVLIVFLINKE